MHHNAHRNSSQNFCNVVYIRSIRKIQLDKEHTVDLNRLKLKVGESSPLILYVLTLNGPMTVTEVYSACVLISEKIGTDLDISRVYHYLRKMTEQSLVTRHGTKPVKSDLHPLYGPTEAGSAIAQEYRIAEDIVLHEVEPEKATQLHGGSNEY